MADIGRRSSSGISLRACAVCLLAMLVTVSACRTGSGSYERHNLSRLWVPDGADIVYFDVTATPQYPRDSAAAEGTRRAWIDEWIAVRKLCENGYEIVARRELTRADDNPYRHDLRYQLRCL